MSQSREEGKESKKATTRRRKEGRRKEERRTKRRTAKTPGVVTSRLVGGTTKINVCGKIMSRFWLGDNDDDDGVQRHLKKVHTIQSDKDRRLNHTTKGYVALFHSKKTQLFSFAARRTSRWNYQILQFCNFGRWPTETRRQIRTRALSTLLPHNPCCSRLPII